MPGQFDKESSRQNYEWHRERALRAKKEPSKESLNRMIYNVNAIEKSHGKKAAEEMVKEINSKKK